MYMCVYIYIYIHTYISMALSEKPHESRWAKAHSRPVASFRDLLDLETGTHHIILDPSGGASSLGLFFRVLGFRV